MTIEVSLNKPTLAEYIKFTEWMLQNLQKTKSLARCFNIRDKYSANSIDAKTNFIRSFLEVYNSIIYLRDYIHTSEDAIELYCKQFGSPRDLQCYKLINSSAERFKFWSTGDYRQLCLELSEKLSPRAVEYIMHEYFQFLPSDYDLSAFFKLDYFDINTAPHKAYCCALFEKYHRIYTGLKTEHEYIIKPLNLEVTKSANNYYGILYNSMPN